MKDNLTEIVAIIDNSGSMEPQTDDTIGGFNTFLKEQKELPSDAILSTVLFNTEHKILHDRINIKDVKPITRKEYKTGGGTALLDAMGSTIDRIGKALYETKEEDRPSKVIVFIITDGQENASAEYRLEQIREKVELQRNVYKWEFMFVGANMDSIGVASGMGFNSAHGINYTKGNEHTALYAMSSAVTNYRNFGDVDKGEDYKSKVK